MNQGSMVSSGFAGVDSILLYNEYINCGILESIPPSILYACLRITQIFTQEPWNLEDGLHQPIRSRDIQNLGY
jgi:hypothetical protein